jgi:hypothetical protein
MTHIIEMYDKLDKDNSDIIIDWGDGTEPLSVKTAEILDISTFNKNKNDKYVLAGQSGLLCYNNIDGTHFIVAIHTYETASKY